MGRIPICDHAAQGAKASTPRFHVDYIFKPSGRSVNLPNGRESAINKALDGNTYPD